MGAGVFFWTDFFPLRSSSPLLSNPAARLSAEAVTPEPSLETLSDTRVTVEALHTCLNQTEEQGRCLDELYGVYLETHSTLEALRLLDQYRESDSGIEYACHAAVHSIGRQTFLQQRNINDAFFACDHTCNSGCYHGAVEHFFLEEGATDEAAHVDLETVKEKSQSVCDPITTDNFLRSECQHGLGHALVFIADYSLQEALDGCDVLKEYSGRDQCYMGAFMENNSPANPLRRGFPPTDFHYPCTSVKDKYKYACYQMQAPRLSEMGLSTEQMFAECRKAGAYREACDFSIGLNLVGEARTGSPGETALLCAFGRDLSERLFCIQGIAFSLIQNTRDGQSAFPFCDHLIDRGEQIFCFGQSREYLHTIYGRDTPFLQSECEKYAASSVVCTNTASSAPEAAN